MGGTVVAIALGSNLGDRRGHIEWAIEQLGHHLSHLRASSIIETEPFEVSEPQPPYLNAVVVGETALDPHALLAVLARLEKAGGRDRRSFRAARTLDLDLILYGDLVIDTPALTVPHARFRERLFVLEPLAEVAGESVDPLTGRTAREILRQFKT